MSFQWLKRAASVECQEHLKNKIHMYIKQNMNMERLKGIYVLDILINFHDHSCNDMTAAYNIKLPTGCGYQYLKCNTIGQSQQPANN